MQIFFDGAKLGDSQVHAAMHRFIAADVRFQGKADVTGCRALTTSVANDPTATLVQTKSGPEGPLDSLSFLETMDIPDQCNDQALYIGFGSLSGAEAMHVSPSLLAKLLAPYWHRTRTVPLDLPGPVDDFVNADKREHTLIVFGDGD